MSIEKFKVGDLVRVRSDLVGGRDYGDVYFNPEMEELRGKTYKIASEVVKRYKLKGAGGWLFVDEMLEPAEGDTEENNTPTVDAKETIKIVAVKHVNYQLEPCSEVHYFITAENVNVDDLVYCNTCYGLAVCKVEGVYHTLDEIFKLKKLPQLDHLKKCRTTLKENRKE